MPYDLSAFDAPQSDPGEAIRARLAQALAQQRSSEQPAGPLEGAMGTRPQYFQRVAEVGGMQQPTREQAPGPSSFDRRLGNVRLRNQMGGDPSWNIFGLPYQGRKRQEAGQEMSDQMKEAEGISDIFRGPGPQSDAGSYQRGDLRRGMPPVRPTGIGEAVSNALMPRRDDQGIPKPADLEEILNAVMMALPGARGGRSSPVYAAEKGAGSGGPPETLGGGSSGAVRRNRMSPEERAAGFDRLAREMEADGLRNKSTFDPAAPDAWEQAAAEIRAERAARAGGKK